jgi:hypothetical protein
MAWACELWVNQNEKTTKPLAPIAYLFSETGGGLVRAVVAAEISRYHQKNEKSVGGKGWRMTMTHEEIQQLLMEYCSRELPPDRMDRIKTHLQKCESCQDQVVMIHYLKSVNQDEIAEPLEIHPNAREITDFALEEGDTPDEARTLIKKHLAECDQCREFVAFTRQVQNLPEEKSVTVQTISDSGPRPWLARQYWLGYAAAAILLVMLFAIPRESARPFIAGDVAVALRDATLSSEIPQITMDRDLPYFQVVINSNRFAGETDPGDRMRVTVRSLDGDDLVLEKEGLFSEFGNKDLKNIITIVLPMEGRHPGEYEVKLDNLSNPGVQFRSQFTLTRAH